MLPEIFPNEREIWSQQDGAVAHFDVLVCRFFDNLFANTWTIWYLAGSEVYVILEGT